MNTQAFDLIIAGGGLAGASLACAVGALGRRVAVIESYPMNDERQPSFDERTIALTLASRRVFEGVGVWPAVSTEACPIDSIHVSDRGRFGAARLDRRDVCAEALGYVVPTRTLGHALNERMRALGGVTMICPDTAERIERDDAAVIVRTAGGLVLSAPLLVIADGGRSTLGREAGLVLEKQRYPQMALVAIVGISRDHGNRAYERFTRHGPLALLPMTDRRMALAWTLPQERAGSLCEADEPEFLAALAKTFGGRCGTFIRAGARRAYPLSQGKLAHPVANRVVAIGNAAHVVHPVAGQGFNLGLRDIAELSDYLSTRWASGADIGEPSALHAYGRRRHAQSRRVGLFTDGLIRLFTSTVPGVGFLRAAGLNVVDLLPPAKRFFLDRTMGHHGRLPRLTRGLSAERSR